MKLLRVHPVYLHMKGKQMASPIEKLKREVTTLEARHVELKAQRDDRNTRANALEVKRRDTIAEELAEGRPSRDGEKELLEVLRLRTATQDFGAAIAAVEKKLAIIRTELARAERQDAINALEAQIAELSKADNSVDMALHGLRTATEQLFASARAVANSLNSFDAQRWDVGFATHLELDIRRALTDAVSVFGLPVPGVQQPFASRVATQLRSAVTQLRFESLEGKIEPKRGEELFRVLSKISGLRDLILVPGNLVALRPDEAEHFVRGGSLERLAQRPDAEAAA
jgi:hypothetical protein